MQTAEKHSNDKTREWNNLYLLNVLRKQRKKKPKQPQIERNFFQRNDEI